MDGPTGTSAALSQQFSIRTGISTPLRRNGVCELIVLTGTSCRLTWIRWRPASRSVSTSAPEFHFAP